jgi:hypothetical protein
MFSTTTGSKARPIRAKVALISALSLGAAILPVTLAGPAQAAPTQTSQRSCTVTAGQPVKVWRYINFRWVERVKYPGSVTCPSYGRWVNLQKTFYEDDGWFGQTIGADSPPIFWVGAGQTVQVPSYRPVVNTEVGNEEVYQKITIQEGYANLWTTGTWRVSPIGTIINP